MAITNRESTQVTNIIDTAPSVRNDAFFADGVLRSNQAVLVSAADDTAASLYRILRLPSHCNVRSLKVSAADATTAGAINIGVHYSEDNDASATAAVIDADYFATALDLAGGPLSRAEQIDESGTNTQAKQLQPLWEALGLSSDPGGYFDITATISTTFNGGPTSILVEAQYTL